MKMEMSYRDKMVLLIVGVIVILVGGFFALIKPTYDKKVENEAIYKKTQETWEVIDREIKAIPTYQKKIEDIYNEANGTAKIFVNSAFASANKNFNGDRTSYELDQYLQKAMDESNVEVRAMDLGPVEARNMEYYYHVPNVLTYSLLEAADVNGNYAKKAAETLKAGIVLETRETAELMAYDIELTVEGTKENLMAFLEKIQADNNAILVTSTTVENYKFTDGLELDEFGDPLPGENLEEGTSNVTVIVTFYNATTIDKPNTGK